MNDVRDAWEDRAKRMGSGLSGVLFKGFTEQANALLDSWHCRLVLEVLAPHVRQNGTLLDIGCGFGRLSLALARQRPDVAVVGQDISLSYCMSYARAGYPAVQADLTSLPFTSSCAAGAMAVTSLMYAARQQVLPSLERIRNTLEPGGVLLVVDPGEELRTIGGALRGTRKSGSTGGQGFRRREYLELAQKAGFDVIGCGGNPRDSALFAMTGGGRIGWKIASRVVPRDDVRGGYSFFALHRWLLLKVREDSPPAKLEGNPP